MKNVVVMFPYPSGEGLHLGHYYNYALVDSYCRFLRYEGEDVFQPFGYDAFGLPAENYARQVGGDPKTVTLANIQKFRGQMKQMNTMFEEQLITCSSDYQKWTQWIFNQLLQHNLAYKKLGIVNYCSSCQTVLANEQVHNGRCHRCETVIEYPQMKQWYFKITDYKDRLLEGLNKIDYPEPTKKMQFNWLKGLRDWCVSRQRKWGCPIPIDGETDTLDTFVDSSFYYLRYLTNSQNEFLPAGSYKPIDLYIGGKEHACMHLIYARFIHYFLYDIGIVPQEEPFNRVIHQGMITKDGTKMAKSKGNAISPDSYNSDELRMYLMFIGPYFKGGEWNDNGVVGIRRFLNRVKVWLNRPGNTSVYLGCLIDDVKKYVYSFKFNKVVSTLMEFYNKNKNVNVDGATRTELLKLFRCFVPGLTVQFI